MRSKVRAFVVRLSFCLLLPATAFTQTDVAGIKARLTDRPLYLRGLWRADKLQFDGDGKPTGSSDKTSFTVCGFSFQKASLKNGSLVLKGTRIGLEYKQDKWQRVSLEEPIQIQVAAPAAGDFGLALDAIFVEQLADLIPSLPPWWRPYATKAFGGDPSSPHPTSRPTTQPSSSPTPATHIGGGVHAPRLLSSTDPQYTQYARALRHKGTTLINLWVEPDGSISHLSVVRPLGLGLDENALAAVNRYKFAPALEDGTPVRVELNVEVNFDIF